MAKACKQEFRVLCPALSALLGSRRVERKAVATYYSPTLFPRLGGENRSAAFAALAAFEAAPCAISRPRDTLGPNVWVNNRSERMTSPTPSGGSYSSVSDSSQPILA